MSGARVRRLLVALLPWIVSGAALAYVFGVAIDWQSIPAATAGANLPLFIAIIVADKILFFLFWGIVQAELLRRFLGPVSRRNVLAVKGGAELMRTVNNPAADATFLIGVSQLTRAGTAAVVTVASIPFVCHFLVLLLQATLSLGLLADGPKGNPDVLTLVVLGWSVVAFVAVSVRMGWWRRLLEAAGVASRLGHLSASQLLPWVGLFILFATLDVLIQGSATRAFGVSVDWTALMARIPLMYVVMALPSLGNFGTREIAWTYCFAEFGTREALIAYALWTNVIFLIMHVLIGTLFFGRALELLREVRRARREGEELPRPLLHDAIDP